MIPALIAKDLRLIARDRNFFIALAVYLFIYLVASLIFFSDFLAANHYPFPAMSSLLFSRISVLQGALVAALTPWLILSMNEQDLNGEFISLNAGMLAAPWKIILAKLVVSAICLFNLIILSLPVFCLVRLLDATTFRQIGWVLLDTFIFLLVLTMLVFHVSLRFKSWLSCWILSYAALGIAGFIWYRTWLSLGRESCSQLFLLLLILFVVLLFPHGYRVLSYERN